MQETTGVPYMIEPRVPALLTATPLTADTSGLVPHRCWGKSWARHGGLSCTRWNASTRRSLSSPLREPIPLFRA